LLQIENIELHFGERVLFNGITALINPGDRVGLVGPNGAGKSTLLKIIAGQQEPDGGRVIIGGESTVGYLPQDGVDPNPKLNVFQEVESAFKEILYMQDRVETLQKNMGTLEPGTQEHTKTMDEYGKLQNQLELSGAYTLKSDIEKILMGLGFSEDDFTRSTTEFSGGWLMRIALAKLLLRKPTFLFLDEPTNHLDIESLQWIENFLRNYEGAVIIVSHDRAFLDAVTTRTLALARGRLDDFAGNYSFFERKSAEQKELMKKAYDNQQKEIKETERFIERFRAKSSKAKQVQSRVKQLDKVDRIEIEDDLSDISFRFPEPVRAGQVVMTLNEVKKSYGDHPVFDGVNLELERGDKVAVVGPNGAGKSTLIRILAGSEPVSGGERKPGYNVTTSYFAQHQADELDVNLDVLEEMRSAGSRESDTKLRTILGCFLFQGDDVFKKVKVLSGGEKSRLALAKMLITPANFLIFDEPTNHLDMQSKYILQQALQQYEGTVMIVSHDRAFLDPIVNKTLEVQPGYIKTWLGTVSFYLDKKAAEAGKQPVNTKPERLSDKNRKDQRRLEAEKRQERNKKLGPLKKKLQEIEKEIAKAETRKKEIETRMADPAFYDDAKKVKKVSLEYESVKNELNDFYSKWEEVADRIEFMDSD